MINYDENFYKEQKEHSAKAAALIVPMVIQYIDPKSVIDVGCGLGQWLSAFTNQNADIEIQGIDSEYIDRKQLFIDEKYFRPVNLDGRITLGTKYDLAVCLEVAEQLKPERADSFVEDLTKLSDVVLFSSAILGQGGNGYINEQMQSYWVQKFAQHEYVCLDCLRPKIWQENRIITHYKQNMFLYVKQEALSKFPDLELFHNEHREGTIYDTIHPETWIGRMIAFNNLVNQMMNNQRGHAQQGRQGYHL